MTATEEGPGNGACCLKSQLSACGARAHSDPNTGARVIAWTNSFESSKTSVDASGGERLFQAAERDQLEQSDQGDESRQDERDDTGQHVPDLRACRASEGASGEKRCRCRHRDSGRQQCNSGAVRLDDVPVVVGEVALILRPDNYAGDNQYRSRDPEDKRNRIGPTQLQTVRQLPRTYD